MLRNAMFTLVLTAFSAQLVVSADTLIMEGITESAASIEQRPTRGMKMDQVRNQWGSPLAESPPVGEPPISQWVYGDYVVYFEGNWVLNSVVKHPSDNPLD